MLTEKTGRFPMSANSGDKEHHKQQDLCKTRPAYRQGRQLTSVKVYTVNAESQHLFVYGVPQINLRYELKNLCSRYGQVLGLHVVLDHETEIFTECYHVRYQRIQSARIAKRFLDGKSFYGGLLHVCYAPEYEDVEETRAKLLQRKKDVEVRTGGAPPATHLYYVPDYENAEEKIDDAPQVASPIIINRTAREDRKRKHPALTLTGERMMKCLPPAVVTFPKRGVQYGPHLPDFVSEASELDSAGDSKKFALIPTQVKGVKQIVFRKK